MRYLYSSLLLLTSLLWSGDFVVGKFLVGHASSMTLTNLRWMIAVVCLLPIVWIQEKRILPTKRSIIPLVLMGLTGVVLYNVFMFLALERTDAMNVGLLSTLNPVSIAIFSFLLVGEKIRPLQMAAMVLSFFGVVIVLSRGEVQRLLTLDFNVGDFWMLAAVALWGLYSVFGKWAMRETSPLMSTLYSAIFGILILLPFNLSSFTVTNVNPSFIWSVLYMGVLSTVVSMVFWNIGVQKLGGTTAGMFLNFNPIFTAILSFLVLGEQMTWTQFFGSVVVITGCYLFGRFKVTPVSKDNVQIKHVQNA
ncbi:DMT family transporter [Niallia endozanthoxylica]|uniref:EamA family transporter n=1 Tax=Niallia endozanthoxylica TaxID=2036016 RepID=A0A5J5HPI9_9BACI|nr:EamA family transporter [Niallia endozanthoxylica]KAA9022600.1 EamA family transporter [Niallia endozanthoxylica]